MYTSRYLLASLFVAAYIALGIMLKLEAEAYLLLGIPLMVLFQLVVVRKPLHNLWLRDGGKFSLNKQAWLIALCLALFPIYKIVLAAGEDKLNLVRVGYCSAAVLGAVGAGYCFSRFTKKTTKDFFLCLGIIAVIRAAMYLLPVLIGHVIPDYLRGLKSLFLYVPVAFIVEEVIFRGMLDTYVNPAQSQKSLGSALFVSALWGLWHLPLTVKAGDSVWLAALASMTISLWGIPLSIFWRRSGNLAVPAFSHAFADAIRDAVK